MNKLRKIASSPKMKKVLAVSCCMVVLCTCFVIGCCAADTTSTNGTSAVNAATTIFSTMSTDFSVANIVAIIGITLAASVGLYLAWWAIKKVSRAVISAFNGKIKVK